MTMEKLCEAIRECRRCRLCETRMHALCGEGNPDAKLLLVALSPGVNEDREGRMFIGPSGRVLDELLLAAGIGREEVYMTNLLKCMLPKCRKPKRDEVESCSVYLDTEIGLINPKIIAPLGYFAIRHVFGKYAIDLPPKAAFHEIFGTLFVAGDKVIIPLRHPASVLYDHALKETLIKNYRRLNELLKEQG